jgi:hypothetical protein
MNFFIIYKNMGPNQYRPIYKSEIQPAKQSSYEWNLVTMLSNELTGGDIEREIKMEFYAN